MRLGPTATCPSFGEKEEELLKTESVLLVHCVFLEGRGKNEHVQGGSDIQGCGCGLHRGGTGAAGLCSEEVVPRCDGRELQEPGLSGTSTLQTRYLTYRKRREALDDRDITPDGEKFR
ncbi:uncharacterized protein LOC114510829 isoform X3 [Phyllostomus discolor]|uniref:Uncharacterized protein LOC114510829 isoform X3 n=1 Tax=Phyllostomus discolor TaxID=89673 RepID=A0A7E6CPJ4_9CHIR|nr:uncharacterized protein LOC114510829 isoform X3 [Phyllostomus discolor]